MTAAVSDITFNPAITYFVPAIEFVITMELADLVVAIALVLAFGLRVIASTRASGGEQRCNCDDE
jgi:hypothetical protein